MLPFKERNFQIYRPQVFSYEKPYNENVLNEIVKFSIHHKRELLVIFEYIYQVNELHKYLDKHKKILLDDTTIFEYIRSDLKHKFLEKEVKPNTIILSINLGGRGTDIKISPEVNKICIF